MYSLHTPKSVFSLSPCTAIRSHAVPPFPFQGSASMTSFTRTCPSAHPLQAPSSMIELTEYSVVTFCQITVNSMVIILSHLRTPFSLLHTHRTVSHIAAHPVLKQKQYTSQITTSSIFHLCHHSPLPSPHRSTVVAFAVTVVIHTVSIAISSICIYCRPSLSTVVLPLFNSPTSMSTVPGHVLSAYPSPSPPSSLPLPSPAVLLTVRVAVAVLRCSYRSPLQLPSSVAITVLRCRYRSPLQLLFSVAVTVLRCCY